MRRNHKEEGFTLIELSIVLVIIGLILGSVLVGRDLIAAAQTRAQLTQLEHFNTAVNTFNTKYGFLPGDIPLVTAAAFGLPSFPTDGDGTPNGDGTYDCAVSNCVGTIYGFLGTENLEAFAQLSAAKLIDGSYCGIAWHNAANCPNGGPAAGYNYPAMKANTTMGILPFDSPISAIANTGHWFMLGIANNAAASMGGWMSDLVGNSLTPAQAYSLDAKIDDGLPSSGRVLAVRVIWSVPAQDDAVVLDTNQGSGVFPAVTSPGCINAGTTPTSYNTATGAAANTVSCLLVVRMQ